MKFLCVSAMRNIGMDS